MRTVDPSVLAQMLAPQTGHSVIPLLKISHSSLTTPLYYAGDYKDVTYNSQVYTAFPFEIVLPDDTDETVPQVKLVIDNVGQDLVNLIRSAGDPPSIQLHFVDISPSNVVTLLIGPLDFSLLGVSYTMSVIEMSLGYESDLLNAAATSEFFDPTIAPGLF